MAGASEAAAFRDRVYHGFSDVERYRRNQQSQDDPLEVQRIWVEKPAGGPTERRTDLTLYELLPPEPLLYGGFHWGYDGAGPGRTAAAVLADALEPGTPQEAGMGLGERDEVREQLRLTFVEDAVSQLCDEWRLRCTLVMRWARAWYLQHYPTHLPERLHRIPTRAR